MAPGLKAHLKFYTPMLAIAVLLVTGCAGAPALASPKPPAPTAPATTTPAATRPPSSLAPSPLENVWHSGVVTPDMVRAALQASGGLQQWQQAFVAGMPEESVFTLRILNGRWVEYWSKDGGPDEENDSGPYSISGDNVTISHSDPGTDTFQWSVEGDTLTLKFLSDTFPTGAGIPERVYQTAFYQSAPWITGQP